MLGSQNNNADQLSHNSLASYADVVWARHAILPHECGGGMHDKPKELLRRRVTDLTEHHSADNQR